MRYRKSKVPFYSSIILFLFVFVGVGYAYLNTSLGIEGITKVSKNTWDIHFENLVVKDGSAVASSPATIQSDSTNVKFGVDLNTPGDFYEFNVDVVNKGSVDAQLSEIVKNGLSDSYKDYFDFVVTYSNGQEILVNDVLEKQTTDSIKVSVIYKNDSSLPSSDLYLNLSVVLNYIQKGTGSNIRNVNSVIAENAVLDNKTSTYVSSSSGIDFTKVSSNTNGNGVYIRSGTENKQFPIVYYRGAVKNNNVLFGGKCWKIIRTTETGGTKLIYNGVPDSNNQCTSTTGSSTTIGKTTFNSTSTSSFYDSGYMTNNYFSLNKRSEIGKNYWYALAGLTTTSNNINGQSIIVSDSITYSNGKYNLSNPQSYILNADSYPYIYHMYTCMDDSYSCATVRNIVNASSSTFNTVSLSGGATVDSVTQSLKNSYKIYVGESFYEEMGNKILNNPIEIPLIDFDKYYSDLPSYMCFDDFYCSNLNKIVNATSDYFNYYSLNSLFNSMIYDSSTDPLNYFFNEMKYGNDELLSKFNVNNSTIKTNLEDWYANNLLNYSSFIEDTLWINDRTVSDYDGYLSTPATQLMLNFIAYRKNFDGYVGSYKKSDSFGVNVGNKKAKYPVGTITIDEANLAGLTLSSNNLSNYLYNGISYFTMTPYKFNETWSSYDSYVNTVSSNGSIGSDKSVNSNYYRPMISLSHNVKVSSGDGTSTKPYLFE